eukprot:gene3473-biopygen3570
MPGSIKPALPLFSHAFAVPYAPTWHVRCPDSTPYSPLLSPPARGQVDQAAPATQCVICRGRYAALRPLVELWESSSPIHILYNHAASGGPRSLCGGRAALEYRAQATPDTASRAQTAMLFVDRLGEDAARAYLDAVERQRSALRRRPQAFWPGYIISEPDFDTHPRCKSSKAVSIICRTPGQQRVCRAAEPPSSLSKSDLARSHPEDFRRYDVLFDCSVFDRSVREHYLNTEAAEQKLRKQVDAVAWWHRIWYYSQHGRALRYKVH